MAHVGAAPAAAPPAITSTPVPAATLISVHLPAADARNMPKNVGSGRHRGAAAPRCRHAVRICSNFAQRAGARHANSPNSLCELWHAVRIYTVAL